MRGCCLGKCRCRRRSCESDRARGRCNRSPISQRSLSSPCSGFLTNGSEIAADQIGPLTGALDTLTSGLATWQGLAGSCTPAARDGFLFRFSYASGPPVDVYLHTENCDHMGFSNGAVTGYIPKKLFDNSAKFLPDMGFAAAGEAVK